ANTRAALITRGLAELIRLGTALGGRQETFMGLAGLGDLVLTCTDNQSRNRRMGLALARGLSLDQARAEIGQEVEGVITAQAVHAMAQALGVEMPISEQVYGVLYQGLTPAAATTALLERSSKVEFY
ncbi:MAG TPA: NAD(P)H-dependent glycerol-3-phosphate dehydrogenase, partial [Chromatiaceae bacterium]|nr:NAD(P)H-dependent glycerol-3-phosphate dehydrogenase [Chromatiaceae bacterium]